MGLSFRRATRNAFLLFLSVGVFHASAQTIYFQSTAETGDLSEWVADGGGHVFSAGEDWKALSTQGVHASNERAHTGRYSIRCHLPDPTRGQDAKLYRERAGDPSSAYYSCWFWFDKSFQPSQWVNIFQWKTKMGVFSPLCDPTFVINVFYRDGIRRLQLYHWPVGQKLLPRSGGDTAGGSFEQTHPKPVPAETWVHIEAFYRIDRVKGEVVVWQDGVRIFSVADVNTQDSRADHPNTPATLLWGVGVYSSPRNTAPLLLYLDDATISSVASPEVKSR